LLPVVIGMAVARLGGSGPWGTALAFAQPLFLGLAISFLSDASGLLFLLVGLLLATPWPERGPTAKSWFWAGVALGFSLACRPSYGVLILAAGLALLAVRYGLPGWRRQAVALLCGGLLVVVPVFGAVLAWEGVAYLDEGLRFLKGHTTLWGQTPWSETPVESSWIATIGQLEFGLIWFPLLALGTVLVAWPRRRDRALIPWLVTALVALVWTLTMQNPANARHLAPLLSMMLVCAGGLWSQPGQRSPIAARGLFALLLCAMAFDSLRSIDQVPVGIPPLQQVAQRVEPRSPSQAAPLLITNHGVALFRQQLQWTRVVDPTYGGDAQSVLRTWRGGTVYLLRSIPLTGPGHNDWMPLAQIPGRAWGEAPLWLYEKR
jgi:hypothetical protein